MTLEEKLNESVSSQKNIDIVFKEIYDKFYKLVAFCIARYVKSKQDVEDLSDDVFVNFYKHINSIEITNIKYYLTTSAKNTSLNFLRSFHETDELNEELLVDKSSEKDLSMQDIFEQFKNILTREELQIIIDHTIYDYTFEEIAKDSKISMNTIKSKYRRAIEKVKKTYPNMEEL